MYFSPDYAAGGPDMLRTRAATSGRIRLRALRSYTAGATFADVSAATIGIVSVTPGDITDTPNPATGVTLRTTLGAKTLPVTVDDPGTTLRWAITDETASVVLLAGAASVPPEDLPLRSGGSLVLPASEISRHVQA